MRFRRDEFHELHERQKQVEKLNKSWSKQGDVPEPDADSQPQRSRWFGFLRFSSPRHRP